ncbi:MAG: PqqD family protein, partial [Acidobacteriota bacterium]
CDGHNSIDSIVKALCNRYKLTHKEAETSLLAYFRKLGKRGMIAFAMPKKASQETKEEEAGPSLRAGHPAGICDVSARRFMKNPG